MASQGLGLANVADLRAVVYTGGAVEEVGLDRGRADEFERLLRVHADADAVIVWGSGAWASAAGLFSAAEVVGFNPYALDVVDEVEGPLAGVDLRVIVKLRLERILAGRAGGARVRVSTSRAVSRRAILLNPLAVLTEYAPAPLVDAGRCAGHPRCSLCVESCPFGAIRGKPPTVDADSCIGCMECVYSCPGWALHPPGYSREGLVGYIEGLTGGGFRGVMVVSAYADLPGLYGLAGRGSSGIAVLPVHSLTFVHPRLAVEAASRGIRLTVYDPRGEAPGWVHEAEAAGLALLARHPDAIAEAAGASARVQGGVPAGEALYPFMGMVEVDRGKCTLCSACAVACPTGALTLKASPDTYELLLRGDACTGCMECAAVCPEGAIEVRWAAGIPGGESAWVRVAWSEAHRCPSCDSVVGPKAQIEAVARKLREAGLPEPLVRSVYLCPTCKASLNRLRLHA